MDTGQSNNSEIERLADFISSLPSVSSPEDVAKVPGDAHGIYAERLDDKVLMAIAQRITNIRYITCSGNNHVTDAGLSALKHFTKLEWLDLEWSKITDTGLSIIAAVSTLKKLDIGFSLVTASGIESLKFDRPDLSLL